MMMPTGTALGLCGILFSFQGGAGLAKSVQNGAAAVHLKAVMGGNVGQKLLADGTFQMNQLTAGDALQVEMVAAISQPNVLVDVSGLGIAAVFPRQTLVAQLGEMTVYRTLTAGLTVPFIHFGAKLLHRKLAVGPAFQKIQQPLSPRCFIHTRHGISLLSAQTLAVYKYSTTWSVCQAI